MLVAPGKVGMVDNIVVGFQIELIYHQALQQFWEPDES